MLFFCSDAHFCNKETLTLDNRPFSSPNKFDKAVVKIWNKQANKKDTIYFIGDFVDCDDAQSVLWKKSIKYVCKIKAKVVLIIGNNESRVIKYFFDDDFEKFRAYCIQIGFQDVLKNCIVNIKGLNFYLVHKPKDCVAGMLNLFGHVHRSGGIYRPFGFNIGCDLNHFRLYSEDDIMHLVSMKEKFWDKDKNLKLWEIC